MAQAFPVRCTNCGHRADAMVPPDNIEEGLRNLVCRNCGNIGTLRHIAFG
jgi:DNA-directed RNA polymerase subunit RPC12/RpoP